METKNLVRYHNKFLMQRLVKEINALPKLQTSCVHNPEFNELIVELTENQKLTLKNLLK